MFSEVSALFRKFTHFSLSINVKAMLGMTFDAMSSMSKHSSVAIKDMSPATRVCTNGSFSARANAGTSTFRFVLYPSEGPRRPIRMQVFVRMDASWSACIRAR